MSFDEMRQSARRYLEVAIPELSQRDERHSPDWSEPPPWIRIDLASELAVAERDRLADAIRTANPDRFATPHADARRYAAKYPPALLRAVVARSRVEHVEPGAESPITSETIAELIERVSMPAWSWRTVNILAEVDAEEVDGRDIHGVAIHVVRRRGEYDFDGWQRAVSLQMPEAVQELWEQDVFGVEGRIATALLVVTDEREIPEHRYFRDAADERLGRVATAMRLASGATIDLTATCRGEPFYVHQDPPFVQQGQGEGFPTWHRRPLRLTPDLSEGIGRLAETIESEVSDPLAVALGRYTRSHQPAHWQDRVVDLAVAMEAALIGPGQGEEITLRICSRAAHLLATEDDPAASVFDDVSDLYKLRSIVVHGGTDAERVWRRFTQRHAFGETLAADRLTPAWDRFRDLTRRAIVARLTLRAESLGGALWRDRGTQVDRALVDPVERGLWRAAIRERCEGLGVPDACRTASPLRDLWEERKAPGIVHLEDDTPGA